MVQAAVQFHALRAVLDDEAHSADADLACRQMHAQGGVNRLGGLLGRAVGLERAKGIGPS